MITEKVTRFKFFVCVSIILATIMGVYAQDIAYYIVGNSPNTTQIYLNLLTILTVLSVGLFVVTPIGIYIFIKKISLYNNALSPQKQPKWGYIIILKYGNSYAYPHKKRSHIRYRHLCLFCILHVIIYKFIRISF